MLQLIHRRFDADGLAVFGIDVLDTALFVLGSVLVMAGVIEVTLNAMND